MTENRGFLVKSDRFSLVDNDLYIIHGWLKPEAEVEVMMDGRKLSAKLSRLTDYTDERYGGIESRLELRLPSDAEFRRLDLYAEDRDGRHCVFAASAERLREKRRPIRYFVDDISVLRADGLMRIQGWACAKEPVRVDVYGPDGKHLIREVERYRRYDTAELFEEYAIDPLCGFNIELRPIPEGYVTVRLRAEGDEVLLHYPTDPVRIAAMKAGKLVGKAEDTLRFGGAGALLQKTWNKLFNPAMRQVQYGKWIRRHLPSEREIAKQRAEKWENMPLVSIVVPCYRTPEKYLRELVISVRAQSYPVWELLLSDGSGENSPIAALLDEIAASDSRIRVIRNNRQLRIAENTNSALEEAKGDWIAFSDHDDLLVASALYECMKLYCEHPDAMLIYTDEDKIGAGDKLIQPNLKPDYDPDFLNSVNYICHLTMVRRELLEETGLLDPAFDGAQDYDFILRCTEKTGAVYHVPKILYHWRFFDGSTSANPESKSYAFEAGRRAIQAHYDRLRLPAEVMNGEYPGIYRTVWHWEETPMVSVLIPNKDHLEDLKKCISSLLATTTWPNLEIIIIENNSTEAETFEGYRELEAGDSRIRTVFFKGSFNYSAINNFGEQAAKGDYLLLLNNDTESISDCIREMMGFAMRPDVGAVGARLYYGDDTIQHAGAIVGWGGVAGHAFVNQPRGVSGYQHRIICQQDYSAVTAACVMIPRKIFREAGGFTEDLAVAFNDIDLCMKIRELGYLIVYQPFAELYHYESKSRGLENTPEKQSRFSREIAYFRRKWPKILAEGDPYYNVNLSMVTQDFSLRKN